MSPSFYRPHIAACLSALYFAAPGLRAILLAMTGLLGPVVGALVHNAGSVVVIIHSALLLRYHYRPADHRP